MTWACIVCMAELGIEPRQGRACHEGVAWCGEGQHKTKMRVEWITEEDKLEAELQIRSDDE